MVKNFRLMGRLASGSAAENQAHCVDGVSIERTGISVHDGSKIGHRIEAEILLAIRA